MLRELLNNSPDIWISDIESDFIPRFTRTIERFGDLQERTNFERCAEELGRTRAFWYWTGRGITIDTQRWYDRCRSHDWAGVLEGLFHCVHEQEISDSPRPWPEILWGDKTPAYMMDVPLLATLFPQARFVHLIRDPRDCGLSAEQAWGSAPLRTAQKWADRVRACRTAGKTLGPERYLEVRYEDLISDVTGKLAELFDFLGVPTPADAGRFLRVPENLGAARGAAHVVAANQQKWKTRMPATLQKKIERVAGDLLDDLGYDREHPQVPTQRLSWLQMNAYFVRDAWRQLAVTRHEQGGWIRGLRFLLVR